MNPRDIPVRFLDLPGTIGGFVVQTPDGETIVLNSRRTHEDNIKAYAHEMRHLVERDFDKLESVDSIEHEAHKEDIL